MKKLIITTIITLFMFQNIAYAQEATCTTERVSASQTRVTCVEEPEDDGKIYTALEGGILLMIGSFIGAYIERNAFAAVEEEDKKVNFYTNVNDNEYQFEYETGIEFKF